ncbi:transcriptional repressor TCF25-domain-containing protein [Tirmania nivea]|nr:transcriptional repressor TCF25-domain-containing protein [Tirmania nivea]
MSSRAVRKALKQRELEEAQEKLASLGIGAAKSKADDVAQDGEGEEENEEEEEEEKQSIPRGKPNLFAMLGGDGDEEVKDEEEDEDEEEAAKPAVPLTSKSKKKKNKKKNKKKSPSDTTPLQAQVEEDEIDRALRLLDLRPSPFPSGPPQTETLQSTTTDTDLLTLLKIDPKNFDASQEMRRLFGRAAVDTPDEGGGGDGGVGTPRGARRGAQRAGMVPGAQVGRRIVMKRSFFAQPKATWPNAGTGGLGMIVVERGDGDGGAVEEERCEFKFVHGTSYQDVQRQFMMCVMSMDPNRLITLLHHNPYHISTLLQISEIFCQQRDHTSSGDLLERALFTFGRSLHSTFPPLLTNPTFTPPAPKLMPCSISPFANLKCPYLSFIHFPNREFYLALWRYIHNLTLRGTFRTASEFSRLLFSLDPKRDPYAMLIYLPILFLKAHQPSLAIALANSETLKSRTKELPAVAYSLPLAYLQSENEPVAREMLAKAIRKFPWVATRIWQVCDLDSGKLPSILWGRVVPEEDNLNAILSELYIERARDLWAAPDAARLLIDTANEIFNLPPTTTATLTAPSMLTLKTFTGQVGEDGEDVIEGVPANIARHVVLTDIPAVTTLLPIGWKDRFTSSYDPLPPRGDRGSGYDMLSGVAGMEAPLDLSGQLRGEAAAGGMGTILELFRTLLPWIAAPPGGPDSPAPGEPREGEPDAPGRPGRYLPDWRLLAQALGNDTAERMREVVEARERQGGIAGGVGGAGGEGALPTGEEEGEGEGFLREVVRVLLEQERGAGGLGAGGDQVRGGVEDQWDFAEEQEQWEVWPEGSGGDIRRPPGIDQTD